MCELVPRYVKRRYYMRAATRRGGFTARWEIRTRDVRVTRLALREAARRREWTVSGDGGAASDSDLSERGESETAESRESRSRSRDMSPTRVRVTSRHSVDKVCAVEVALGRGTGPTGRSKIIPLTLPVRTRTRRSETHPHVTQLSVMSL